MPERPIGRTVNPSAYAYGGSIHYLPPARSRSLWRLASVDADNARREALAAANAGAFTTEIEPFTIGRRTFETDNEPLIMGVVNRSRDSTYRDSVRTADAVRQARILFHQGAHVIDIGAESSRAGGLRVSTHDQIDALIPVVEELSADQVPVSIESYDVDVIKAAVSAGACVVNLTGTRDDDAIFDIVGSAGASLLMYFTPGETVRDELSIHRGIRYLR